MTKNLRVPPSLKEDATEDSALDWPPRQQRFLGRLIGCRACFLGCLRTQTAVRKSTADTGTNPTAVEPSADAIVGAPTVEPAELDPLDNKPWLDLAEDCLALFEEMDRNLEFFETPGERQLAEHVQARLQEILERTGLEVIDQEGASVRTLHQPERSAGGLDSEQLRVEMRSPGFRVGRRILRRARVRLVEISSGASSVETESPLQSAERYSPELPDQPLSNPENARDEPRTTEQPD